MTNPINPIPAGYHTLTPYLTVKDAAAALEFYQKAFGASEVMRLNMPEGGIAHAEFTIDDSHFMISDECPNGPSTSPETLGGSTVKLHLYVNDVDATFAQAIAAGAKETMPVADQFWGDRMGAVVDPFGHHWLIASHVEDVDSSEFPARMEAFFAAHAACGDA
jgi:PhnB protein